MSGVQSIEARTDRRSHARSQARRGKHRPTAAHTGLCPSTATLHINAGWASRNGPVSLCSQANDAAATPFFPYYSRRPRRNRGALPQSNYSMMRSLAAGSRERIPKNERSCRALSCAHFSSKCHRSVMWRWRLTGAARCTNHGRRAGGGQRRRFFHHKSSW